MRWFSRGTTEDRIKDAVREAFNAVLGRAQGGVLDAVKLAGECEVLKRQVSDMKIEKDREQESSDRTTREIEHKLGLHQKQVEAEMDEARRKATLDVEEQHLQARKDQFEERMTFMQGRFEEEVKYQRGLLEKMMKRLPTAEILAQIGNADSD